MKPSDLEMMPITGVKVEDGFPPSTLTPISQQPLPFEF